MDTMSTDNDDVCSVESFDSTTDDVASSPSNERDEYQEVEKSTQDDTIRLQLWRVVVTIVLLSCTLAVTVTTYYVLEAENEDNFEEAVRIWFFRITHPQTSLTLIIDMLFSSVQWHCSHHDKRYLE